MDRRYFLALLVSLLIILIYPHYLRWMGLAPTKEPAEEVEAPVPLEKPVQFQPHGRVQNAGTLFPYKNALYEAVFDSRGGTVTSLKQKDTTFFQAAKGENGLFGLRLFHENQDLSQEIFQTDVSKETGSPPGFIYEKPAEYRITKNYFVGGEKPSLVLEVALENLSDRERHFPLELDYALEIDLTNRSDESKIRAVRFSKDEVRFTDLGSLKKKPYFSAEPAEWHGLTKKYDALLVKPDLKILGEETKFENSRLLASLRLAPVSLSPGEKTTVHILIYAGPQRYETLEEFGLGFEKMLSHGIFGLLHLGLLFGLKFFYNLTSNYGAAILLITLLIKLLFTPLTHLSYASMGKMQALQPKIKALQKQYEKDHARMNKELMELYRRNRVNPMMGCLPLVLQIPIFISFYQVLSDAVELKGADFVWWIHDLSGPDRLFSFPFSLPFVGDAFNLLPILMIGSMLWQQKLTPQPTATAPGQEQLMYLMPIIFGFVFYNLPSGLVLYWLVNNLLTIFHQLFIKRVPVILHHEDR